MTRAARRRPRQPRPRQPGRSCGRCWRAPRQLRPGLRAVEAYVDNASPSVRAALAALARRGRARRRRAAAAAHARLAQQDRRRRVGAAGPAAPTPGCGCATADRSGPHAALVEVLDRRLVEAGRGTRRPGGAGRRRRARPGRERAGRRDRPPALGGPRLARVDVAFASTTAADRPEALERLRRLGHERVAVARYFLGPGRLPRLVDARPRGVAGPRGRRVARRSGVSRRDRRAAARALRRGARRRPADELRRLPVPRADAGPRGRGRGACRSRTSTRTTVPPRRTASGRPSRPGRVPGGTAHSDEPVWRRYSPIASDRDSARCTLTKAVRGSRW